MDRAGVIHWLREHPEPLSRDPEALVSHCHREVQRHATEDAWLAAKAYVERQEHLFADSWGFPRSSEAFVAREVCHRLARELATHEPQVEASDADHLIGPKLLHALDPRTRTVLEKWALDLAESEEHRVWTDIVRMTHAQGKILAKRYHLSTNTRDESGNYYKKAAGIAHMLAEEFEARAHPRPRRIDPH